MGWTKIVGIAGRTVSLISFKCCVVIQVIDTNTKPKRKRASRTGFPQAQSLDHSLDLWVEIQARNKHSTYFILRHRPRDGPARRGDRAPSRHDDMSCPSRQTWPHTADRQTHGCLQNFISGLRADHVSKLTISSRS